MLKKLLLAALMWPLMALAQTYPSPTYQNVTVLGTLTGKVNSTGSTITNATITGGTISGLSSPLPVASGGTNSASASGTALDNITGFAGTGFMSRTGAGAYSFTASTGSGNVVQATSPTIASPTITGALTATGLVTTADLATQAANTVVANATGSSASPTAFAMPGCSSSSSALQWTSGSGFACNTAIVASNVSGTVAIANGGTGLTALGTGVQAALTEGMNNSPNGFAGYNLMLTTGAGITPQEFGAAGNGSTDDTAALQSWLNASPAGQPAFCSAGTYKVTKTLSVTASGLKIEGPQGTGCAITPSFPAGATVSGAAAGATYSGVPSIRLTVSTTANMGVAIEAFGIAGTTEANGAWPAVVIDATHVDIVGPTFAHAWTSGGTIALPVLAIDPTNPATSTQPSIDLSGVYFAPPSANAAATDVAIITGPPAGSNAVFHDFVANGYRRGLMFYNSFAPIIKNAYFYNHLGAAIVANQDISFSNARVDHVEFFSNGNTNLEPAVIIGGANWVENPVFLNSQWSGNNSGGLNFAGNVFGATVIGNYLENNTSYNFSCTGSGNNGATIAGNFFNYNSGTNSTSLTNCNAVTFAGNYLVNQSLSFGGNSFIPATNSFSGTSAITYPVVAPSSVVNNLVNGLVLTSGTPANVTSVALSAGNWACTGTTYTHPAGTTTQSFNATALSTVSASFPQTVSEVSASSSTPAGVGVGQSVGPIYYTFASATTLYIVTQANFATSTLNVDGDIHCQRVF